MGAEYAACTSVAAFGNCLSEGLQLNNGGRNSFCLDRLSLFLPNFGFYAAGQRESVRSGFLQSPSVSDTWDRSEIIYCNLRNGGRGSIEKQFLVEAMVLRSNKAREVGSYLLSIAVPLPSCLESATDLVRRAGHAPSSASCS